MRLDVLKKIIDTDPKILLRSDVPTNEELKKRIVYGLLEKCSEERSIDFQLGSYRGYAKLKHSNLPQQLKQYICDETKSNDVRELAIDIAKACKVHELQTVLSELALNSRQPIHLRAYAVSALCSLGDRETRLKMKPLVLNEISGDDQDLIRRFSLQALWPDCLSASELFQALVPSNKSNLSGGYLAIYPDKITSQLTPEDLIIALDWVKARGNGYHGSEIEALADEILMKSLDSFHLPEIAVKFTEVAFTQWSEHQSIITDRTLHEKFISILLSEDEKRRALIRHTVLVLEKMETQERYISLCDLEEVIPQVDDTGWMVEELKQSSSEKAQSVWAMLIEMSAKLEKEEDVSAIISCATTNEQLYERFRYWLEPIELKSSRANKQRDLYLQAQERTRKKDVRTFVLNPGIKERVIDSLKQLEEGDMSGWCVLNRELTLNPENGKYGNGFIFDITRLPGWQTAEEDTRKRIVAGAKQYIEKQTTILLKWTANDTLELPEEAVSVCKAFQLLIDIDSDFLESLPSRFWKKWAPVIIAIPLSQQISRSYHIVIGKAYTKAPAESIDILMSLIDKDNLKHHRIFVLDRVKECWDEPLVLALLEKATDKSLHPECVGQLLEELIQQNSQAAVDKTKSLVTLPLPTSEEERQKTLVVARILMSNLNPFIWTFLWPLFQQDSSFGREIIKSVCSQYLHGIQLNLEETQLADLYIWLVNQYPYSEDPKPVYSTIARDTPTYHGIMRLRDGTLSQLKNKGTKQACVELQRLIKCFPSLPQLGGMLIEAEFNLRQATWTPLSPQEIIDLFENLEPSNSDIKSEIVALGEEIKTMPKRPKVWLFSLFSKTNVNINEAKNGNVEQNISDGERPSTNWAGWISVVVAILAALFTASFSGVLNKLAENWLFKYTVPEEVIEESSPDNS